MIFKGASKYTPEFAYEDVRDKICNSNECQLKLINKLITEHKNTNNMAWRTLLKKMIDTHNSICRGNIGKFEINNNTGKNKEWVIA
ncbi:hypothetical protein AYI69_g6091 [Smittium culicis]|uniref:Uncharacterized protein n=1 Tax=Smittium culicis TaxID=133412 RepID=A0A1R1Y1S7_9FUNG|nr:hypothetical protein AYI69_g6091 [Smittium culicis]